MCGRYSLTKKEMRIVSRLPPGELQLFLKERFNIAPTQEVPVITLQDGRLAAREFIWGLRPDWSPRPIINAQAESLLRKPTFRAAFQQHRCLVPVDGFYEWRKGDKTPFRFTRPDQSVFCFAGFWDEAPAPIADPCPRFTIITTAATNVVKPIHHRMPLALAESQCDGWLGDADKATAMLREECQVEFVSYAVTPYVNKFANDDPRCLEPAEKTLF